MTTYSAINPLPMRFPATTPPVAGDHIDIGVWPGGWQFLTRADRERFERLPGDEREMFQVAFDRSAEALTSR